MRAALPTTAYAPPFMAFLLLSIHFIAIDSSFNGQNKFTLEHFIHLNGHGNAGARLIQWVNKAADDAPLSALEENENLTHR